MRWIYPDPKDAIETWERDAAILKIDRWWKDFQQRLPDLLALFNRKSEWDVSGWIERHIDPIDSRLSWDFGVAPSGGYRLIITSEAARHLRPLARTIIQRAPKIDGWEFLAYRPPVSSMEALVMTQARLGADLSTTTFKVRPGEHHRLDLVFQMPPIISSDAAAAQEAGFTVAELLLGEQVMDQWIGQISCPVEVSIGPSGPSLEALPQTVESLIRAVRQQLPDRPCHLLPDDAEWSLFKFGRQSEAPQASEPGIDAGGSDAPEYPQQFDLESAITLLPEMWRAAHSGNPFYSVRFSRWKETFCYLKVDAVAGLGESTFTNASQLQDAVNAVIKPAALGAVVAVGTGKRYLYLDLALMDVPRAAEAIRKALREGNVPKRSWLLFHDAEMHVEWIGIWDDTPAPPLITA